MAVPRLYVDHPLAADIMVPLAAAQTHYLRTVMRLAASDSVRVFNGHHGEWRAVLAGTGRSESGLAVREQMRRQHSEIGPAVLFAPIRKERLHMLVEKATELGAGRLQPVITARTDKGRVQLERITQHSIAAAEQCERLSVPEVCLPQTLTATLANWPSDWPLLFLDESGLGVPVLEAIRAVQLRQSETTGAEVMPGILVGPEGGFPEAEANEVRRCLFAIPVDLGRRILRTETAMIATLACWQAFAGDWRSPASPDQGT